nr:flagellar biosynthetic protein FliO [Ensifer sp. 1H6]
MLDAAAVDTRRRLVLVRRDDVEHLIMIGGPTDIVIESRIAPIDESASANDGPAVIERKPIEQPVASGNGTETRAAAPVQLRPVVQPEMAVAAPVRPAAIPQEQPVARVEPAPAVRPIVEQRPAPVMAPVMAIEPRPVERVAPQRPRSLPLSIRPRRSRASSMPPAAACCDPAASAGTASCSRCPIAARCPKRAFGLRTYPRRRNQR